MKNYISILFILFFVSSSILAQDDNYASDNYVAPQGLNNWYVEFGGAGLFYSINYEKYLFLNNNENITWLGRVGLGFNPIEGKLLNKIYLEQGTLMFPFATSFLFGSNKEKLELGFGYTLLSKSNAPNEIIPTGILGFRVMERNGVCFRISYTPHIREGVYVNWFGLSLGKNFNFKKGRRR